MSRDPYIEESDEHSTITHVGNAVDVVKGLIWGNTADVPVDYVASRYRTR